MATYCWRCTECGRQYTSSFNEGEGCAVGHDYAWMKRDYAAEGVGFSGLAEMKRQRESGLDGLSGKREQRDIFLPTARELATPADPTGQKAIREWNERHEPRPTNKAPIRPDYEKTQF